jgi:biopolymer transport protein TolR
LKTAMAFARLSSANREAAPISEINATPLVDVFLVLMLIFLLCAPMAGVQLPLDLPTAGAQGANAATAQPVVIDINAQGQWHWQGRAMGLNELLQAVQAEQATNPQARLQLRADQAAAYGRVAELMAAVQAQGWQQLDLVLRPSAKP